ncbi:MAG TPA: S8 family serine peptidase, partial [Tepidisphaeraceae bacterium]|nr:S8 family serine peptidase [Tepidisphaeraceae bacterium]
MRLHNVRQSDIASAGLVLRRRRAMLAEALEQRLLFASLRDFVGLSAETSSRLLGFVSTAHGGSGQQQQQTVVAGDGLTDSVWLANHVDLPTIALLDKVDGPLQQMVAQSLRDGKSFADMSIGNAPPSDQYEHAGDDPLVTIRSAEPTALAAKLRALGFNVSGSVENGEAGVVDVYTPVSRITELAGVAGVKSLGAEQNLPTDAGSISSTWPGTANIPQLLLDRPGMTGAGIKYGIISDSFNNLGGMAAGIATGDLPAGVTILHDAAGGGTDEGRAMAEVLYDAAPGSNILFYDSGGSKTGMVTAINALSAAGANVIVDDVNEVEGTFQDDVLSQAIDAVVLNKNIPYFTSSGNRNGQTWYGAFNEGIVVDSYNAFDGAAIQNLLVTIPANGTITVDLWWGQKLGGATTDLDTFLNDANTGTSLASATGVEIGGDAFTGFGYTNNTGATITGSISLRKAGGTSAIGLPLFLLTFPGKGTAPTGPFWGGPAAYGHHMSEFGFGVAAVQPASPNTIESFSSLGGVPILFNDDGTAVSGGSVIRNQPALAACDGINTTFFGQFFGTSCAAPDAAAIAGLLLQAAGGGGTLTYSQMRDMLSNSAFDLGSAGYDLTYGAGRIDALASVVAAHENLGSEHYQELNQFGDGSFTGEMLSNSDQASVYFAFDTGGSAPLFQTVSGSNYSYGAIFEYGTPAAATLLQTVRVDSLVGLFTGWSLAPDTRHSLATFARQDINTVPGGTADDMTFSIDGPAATLGSISVPEAMGTGGIDSNLSGNCDTDYFQFTTPVSFDTATGVTIAASFSGGLDGVISVFNTSGTQIARADTFGVNGGETLTTALAASTTYVVRVGSFNGTTSGSYKLRIRAPKTLSNGMSNLGG